MPRPDRLAAFARCPVTDLVRVRCGAYRFAIGAVERFRPITGTTTGQRFSRGWRAQFDGYAAANDGVTVFRRKFALDEHLCFGRRVEW